MIKNVNFKKEKTEKALKKAGFEDILNGNMPLMFKREFIIDECTKVEAGTVCFIKYLICSPHEMILYFFEKNDFFGNIASSKTLRFAFEGENIVVTGYNGASCPLEKLLCYIPDEKINTKIKEYIKLSEEKDRESSRFYDITNTISTVFSIITSLSVVAILLWLISSIPLKTTGILILYGILTTAFAIFIIANALDYDNSRKGKILNGKCEQLISEIINAEVEFMNRKDR